MDLALTIITVVLISFRKIKFKSIYNKCSNNKDIVNASNEYIIGNNLMLKKENRAYHKITDELGLTKCGF